MRTIILVPWAIPPVVNGLMWQWIYDPKIGALNALLNWAGLIDHYQGWLAVPTFALGGLIVAHTWNEFALAAIMFLGALQRVPAELYDAARVDGCRSWQLFWHITLPWLAQALLIVLILETMLAIRAFDIIYVLTAGGPGTSTTTLTWATYLTTFENPRFRPWQRLRLYRLPHHARSGGDLFPHPLSAGRVRDMSARARTPPAHSAAAHGRRPAG